jgi:hypothetical protein
MYVEIRLTKRGKRAPLFKYDANQVSLLDLMGYYLFDGNIKEQNVFTVYNSTVAVVAERQQSISNAYKWNNMVRHLRERCGRR